MSDRIKALATHLGCSEEEISEGYNDTTFGHGVHEYQVLTDVEADERWEEYLDNYIDECLTIPDDIRPYFDSEKWKRDAKFDGRGHSLSSYDGEEHEVKIDDTWYYIYRMN